MNCFFEKKDGKLVCMNCGFSLPDKEYKGGIKRNCKKPASSKKNKIKSFAHTVVKQTKVVTEVVEAKIKQNIESTKEVPAQILGDKETTEKRLAICSNCEHFKQNKCELCGCFMNFKARLENSNCPIAKW